MSGILTLAALAFAPPGLSPTRVRVATCRSVVPVCVDADAVAVAVDAAATSSKLIAGLPAEQVLGGVAAIALLGGGAAMNSNKNASPPAAPVVAPPPPPPAPPPPPPSPTDWYTGKRTAGYHRSAGRWPGDPKREMWVPPAGWKPPTKPVQSWYDKGLRLEPPPAPPAAPEKAKPSSTAFMVAATASNRPRRHMSLAGLWPPHDLHEFPLTAASLGLAPIHRTTHARCLRPASSERAPSRPPLAAALCRIRSRPGSTACSRSPPRRRRPTGTRVMQPSAHAAEEGSRLPCAESFWRLGMEAPSSALLHAFRRCSPRQPWLPCQRRCVAARRQAHRRLPSRCWPVAGRPEARDVGGAAGGTCQGAMTKHAVLPV